MNVLGLSICSREAVKSMRNRGVDDGHIISVCRCVLLILLIHSFDLIQLDFQCN